MEHGDKSVKKRGTSFVMTWFNILCTMAGTGILQLPYTLQQGGWACIALVFIIAVMTCYNGVILINSLYLNPEGKRLAGYPQIGQAACGKTGTIIVQIFHKATLVGVTTLFLILAGKFLLEALGGDGDGMVFKTVDPGRFTKLWTGVAGIVVWIPVVAFKTMKEIAPLAIFGIATSMLVVVVVVVFSFMLYPITPGTDAVILLPPNVSGCNTTTFAHCSVLQTKPFDIQLFPSAFAAITLSFGGHAVFPSIEQHMRRPSGFASTLSAAFITLVFLYVLTAVSGYFVFGGATYSPILCNLPRDSTWMGYATKVTKLLVATHVMIAYPMLMNVVVTELEALLKIEREGRGCFVQFLLRTVLRTAFVAVTVVVALEVPYFAPFMSFVGAACLGMIVFILPVIFHWILRTRMSKHTRNDNERGLLEKVAVDPKGHLKPVRPMHCLEMAWGVFIVLCGATGGAIGGYQSLNEIVAKFQRGDTQ